MWPGACWGVRSHLSDRWDLLRLNKACPFSVAVAAKPVTPLPKAGLTWERLEFCF